MVAAARSGLRRRHLGGDDRRASGAHPPARPIAAGAFALGGAGFAIANDDTTEHGRHRRRHAAARLRLPAAPRRGDPARPAPGAHWHGGARRSRASVDRWDRTTGVVMLDGSRWNAAAAQAFDLAPGDPVTVVGFHGDDRRGLAAAGCARPIHP